jgi:four helix bundle protein
MGHVQRFEDLEVWRQARILVREINRITAQPPIARDFGLKDQMRRAALSVMSNIAEGFESNSPKMFIRYLRIAKASLAEVRSQLYAALDAELIQPAIQNELMLRTEELGRMLRGLITSLTRRLEYQSRDRG